MQEVYEFDEFRVDVGERRLFRQQEVVSVTPKVFELLLALLENNGRTLEKEEIARRLWPDLPAVDEANLARNIFLLRKALGDGENGRRLIETVPKRGYRFAATLKETAARTEPSFSPVGAAAVPDQTDSVQPAIPAMPARPASEADSNFFPAPASFAPRPPFAVTMVALIVAFGIAALCLLPAKSFHPANAEARELCLKGRRLWDKRTPEAFQKAIPLFQQAIDLAPGYALAHVGLADCYLLLGEYQSSDTREAFAKAKAAAVRALQLDEGLAEAHITLGCVLHLYDWEFASAEREFRRGLELKPDNPTAHQWYASYLMSRQRYDEALAAIRRARALDPLSPIIATTEGIVLYHARRYDEAIASLQKTLEWEPDFPAALTYLAMAYTEKGEYDAALASYEQARAQLGDNMLLPGLAYVQARAGSLDAARQLIARMQTVASKTRYSPIYWALVYVGVGEKELALKWLEQCRAEKNPWLPLLNTDPRFAALLTDARFRRLLSTSGNCECRRRPTSTTEVAAVLEQTEPQLRLIVCDADVHQVHDFSGKEAAKLLRGFQFKGGGGTDFRPAITEATKWKPDLLVYLTDLEGESGNAPNYPVLWAVPEGKANAPWGKIIELN